MDGFDQVLMYRDENYRFCAPKLSPVKTEIIAFEYKIIAWNGTCVTVVPAVGRCKRSSTLERAKVELYEFYLIGNKSGMIGLNTDNDLPCTVLQPVHRCNRLVSGSV